MEVKINDLNFSYNMPILKNVTMQINDADILIILGHNGAGKTTLIKCLLNELPIPKDTILLDGLDINKFKDWQRIGYVPQEVNIMGFPVTVYEFLKSFANKKDYVEKIQSTLDLLDINHIKYENVNNLSGGQKRKVYIARALLQDIELLVLDEPLVAVDEKSKEDIKNVLLKLKEKNVSIIIITHNFEQMKEVATHICFLEKEIKFFGTKEKFTELGMV